MTSPAPIRRAKPGLPTARAVHRPIGRIVVEIVAALFLLGLIVPWEPGTLQDIGPQEYSWMLMVHRAVVTGMQFGPQIVMPEGPLAFLGNDVYEPHTFPILILGRIIFALVAFWSLREVGRKFIRSWPMALLWYIAVILLMGTTLDCFFADCAMLLVLNYFLVQGRKIAPSAIAMLVILGAASQMACCARPGFAIDAAAVVRPGDLAIGSTAPARGRAVGRGILDGVALLGELEL